MLFEFMTPFQFSFVSSVYGLISMLNTHGPG